MTEEELTARVEAAEAAVVGLARAEFGDSPGHDFHGNQWGGGSADPSGVGYTREARLAQTDKGGKIDKADAAAKMHGTGSQEHQDAIARFGVSSELGREQIATALAATPLAGVSADAHVAGVDHVARLVQENPGFGTAAVDLFDTLRSDGGETSPQMLTNQYEEELNEAVSDNERGVNYTDEDVNQVDAWSNERQAVLDAYLGDG